jgi:hypothetical protein
MHPPHELSGAKGFDNVVVGPQFEAHYPVNFVISGGQHDDGNVGVCSQRSANVKAVHFAGEADIQNN